MIDYLLREGEYAPSKGKKGVKCYRFRGYKMDPSVRERLMGELGVPRDRVKVDLVPSQRDAQEDLFMTESNSAFFYDWGKFCKEGEVLWANTPFDDLKKVVNKACLEPCKLILVSPGLGKGGPEGLVNQGGCEGV